MKIAIDGVLSLPSTHFVGNAAIAGLPVTRADIESLTGLNWLNDVIINVYLNLIVNRSQNSPELPKVYAFSTFFYLLPMD